ncbi:MAG: hypothetical protein KDA42_04360, partial [Planctomycetales bacterium]|nr:hypothetical protein [Planctomycetales bacterium]
DDLTSIGWGMDRQWGRCFRYAILALVGIIYLASLTPHWFDTSDSALYLMLAENLEAGKGYTLWGYPHVHVPPGFPVLLAALDVVGLGSHGGLNVAMLAMGLITIYVAYLAIRDLRGDEQAFLAVVTVLAFSSAMHRASVRVLSDMPFMLLVWIGLLCFGRGIKRGGYWFECGTIALLASLWMRVVGLPLAAAAAVTLALIGLKNKQHRLTMNAAVLFVGTAATGFFFYLYQRHYTAAFDLPSYGSMVNKVGERSRFDILIRPFEQFLQTGSHFSELLTGQPNASLGMAMGILWIPVALGIWNGWRRREYLPLAVLVGYLGPLLVVRALLPRYLIPVAPILILFFLDGLRQIIAATPGVRRFAPRVLVTFCLIMLSMNVPKCIGLIYRLQWSQAENLRGMPGEVREVAAFLHSHAGEGDLFVSPARERQLGYLSRVDSIPSAARYLETGRVDADSLKAWLERGVVFVVNAPENRHAKSGNRQRIREICRDNGLELVYASSTYEVYSARPNEIPLTARKLDRPGAEASAAQ